MAQAPGPRLLKIRTNLRTIKYGVGVGDRLNGANSNEPYIRVPLTRDYFETPATSVFGGVAKNGEIGISLAAAQDSSRLSKFFSDTLNPRTGVFLLNQKLLSLQGPQTPYAPIRGTFRPQNLILQAELNGSGVHLNSRGGLPFGDNFTGYEFLTRTFYNNDASRLNVLYKNKIAQVKLNAAEVASSLAFGINTLLPTVLFTYGGGAQSPLTIINRNSTTSDYKPNSREIVFKGVYTLTSEQISKKKRSTSTGFGDGEGQVQNFISQVSNPPVTLGRRTNYTQFNRSKTFNTGEYDPNLNRYAYDSNVVFPNKGTDLINYNSLYSSETGPKLGSGYDDIIKFYIAVLDNNNPANKTYIHFRAYLKGFSDNYSATWDPFKYMGRGENFYKYKGFDRSIGFDFDVYVGSKPELFPVYKKLNYLASLTAPDYSETGFMRGNIVQLTVGDYLNDVYGVITGFNFSIPEESSWDISRLDDGQIDGTSAELPLLINVSSFEFKPIHNFVPATDSKSPNTISSPFISLGTDQSKFKNYLNEEGSVISLTSAIP
jgi:hypothetical protein